MCLGGRGAGVDVKVMLRPSRSCASLYPRILGPSEGLLHLLVRIFVCRVNHFPHPIPPNHALAKAQSLVLRGACSVGSESHFTFLAVKVPSAC